jgi:hypothetical protein
VPGIGVDPAAEAAMAADPIGTCANSNGRVDIHPRYKCTATVRRSWNFTVNTYVLWQGTS